MDAMFVFEMEMARMKRNGIKATQVSAENLPLFQKKFEGDPNVLFFQVGSTININFPELSGKAGDILRPFINEKFPRTDKNKISLYLKLMKPAENPDIFKTILFVQYEQIRHYIFVDQLGYNDSRQFDNIEQVIVEIQRMITLIC
jgi:hypothetical protein